MIDQRYMYEQRLHQRRARNGHKFRGGKGGSCLVRAWTENHRKPSTTRVFPNFQGLSVCAIGDTAERTDRNYTIPDRSKCRAMSNRHETSSWPQWLLACPAMHLACVYIAHDYIRTWIFWVFAGVRFLIDTRWFGIRKFMKRSKFILTGKICNRHTYRSPSYAEMSNTNMLHNFPWKHYRSIYTIIGEASTPTLLFWHGVSI